MSDKSTDTIPNEISTEREDLRAVVSELNENVAYLSKMVMQLQRSLNVRRKQAGQTSDITERTTLH